MSYLDGGRESKFSIGLRRSIEFALTLKQRSNVGAETIAEFKVLACHTVGAAAERGEGDTREDEADPCTRRTGSAVARSRQISSWVVFQCIYSRQRQIQPVAAWLGSFRALLRSFERCALRRVYEIMN